MKSLVIIPTYNERENIQAIVPAILDRNPQVDILVVDDSSPDGTADLVLQMKNSIPNLHLLLREKKQGLGKAYLSGFAWGLEKGYEALVEMDADFSHRSIDLEKILQALKTCDFVVGSRWVPEGKTVNWGLGRKVISRGGSLYTRGILRYHLKDWTGGFNAWRREVLMGMGLDQVRSEGYSFQIELKYRALKKGFQCKEVPIVFEDRRVGQSKMSSRIVLEALYRVWQIRFQV